MALRNFEVVDAEAREGEGYFVTYADAVAFGLTGDRPFEVWAIAHDADATRTQRVYPRPVERTEVTDG